MTAKDNILTYDVLQALQTVGAGAGQQFRVHHGLVTVGTLQYNNVALETPWLRLEMQITEVKIK